MVLNKTRKKEIIEDVTGRINNSKSIIFADFRGLKVNNMQSLRKKLKEKDIYFKVIKTTLLDKAFKACDVKIDDEILTRPLVCAFSNSEVEPAKILYEFSQENDKIELLGGVMNKEFITVDKVISLAKLPSREILYAQVIGSIKAPISGLITVLKGNLVGLVSVLKQYHSKVKS